MGHRSLVTSIYNLVVPDMDLLVYTLIGRRLVSCATDIRSWTNNLSSVPSQVH